MNWCHIPYTILLLKISQVPLLMEKKMLVCHEKTSEEQISTNRFSAHYNFWEMSHSFFPIRNFFPYVPFVSHFSSLLYPSVFAQDECKEIFLFFFWCHRSYYTLFVILFLVLRGRRTSARVGTPHQYLQACPNIQPGYLGKWETNAVPLCVMKLLNGSRFDLTNIVIPVDTTVPVCVCVNFCVCVKCLFNSICHDQFCILNSKFYVFKSNLFSWVETNNFLTFVSMFNHLEMFYIAA